MVLIDGDRLADRMHQELCGDVRCVHCTFRADDGGCKVERWLDKAPIVKPKKDGWTSCTDSMPTEYALYLVTTKAGRVKMDRFYPDLKAWGLNTRYGYEQTQYRAWQKMPKPYEGREQ